jgi:uncharacterized protein with NRDE domain
MCFVAVALRFHPEFPLVVAANRDEYFSRPAELLTRWSSAPTIVAGRDLTAGGTWLGLSEDGRFAALTNCRTGSVSSAPGALSRGAIVRDFLLGHDAIVNAVASGALVHQSGYGGFNLIAGTPSKISILSNATKTYSEESSGVFVLSNCVPQIQWPKTRIGKIRFTETVRSAVGIEDLKENLFTLLADSHALEAVSDPTQDDDPPRLIQRLIFVKGVEYGTRASSVIVIDRKGCASFFERTFNSQGSRVSENAVQLNLKRGT